MKFLLFLAVLLLIRNRGVATLVPLGLSLLLLGSQASAQNNALHFTGDGSTEDHVSVPYNSSFDLTQATFETWVKWDGTAEISNLFMRLGSTPGWGYGWGAGIRPNGTLDWWQQDNQGWGPNSTGAVPIGTWTHIAITVVNGGNVTFYINGVNAGSSSGALLINGGTGTLIIGKQGPHNNNFNGAMDELRIWNVARTQTQIQSSMNTELAGTEPNLICYYKFNQGTANGTNTSVTTLTDVVGCNTGTLTSFTLSGTTSNWVSGAPITTVAPPAGAPEINLKGNNINIVDGDATPSATDHTNFGCSNTAVVRTFTIQNLCAATLNISSITNSNPTDYTLGTVPTTIAGGGSATFTVTMNAGAEGTKTATITINSDDANEAAYDFAITGSVSNATTLYADASIGASGSGQSWATAYKTLGEALAAAQICTSVSTVYVAAGVYKPTKKPFNNGAEITTANPRDVTFHLRDGLAVYGGYPAGGGARNVAANATILSGDLAGDDDASNADGNFINERANEIVGTDNAYHVVLAVFATTPPTTRLDGFTITGGNANSWSSTVVGGQSIVQYSGGGIYLNAGTNTLANNTFSGNNCNYYGGGIYAAYGVVTITASTINGNTTSSTGAGLYAFQNNTTLTNSILHTNTASTEGGGVYIESSTNVLTNNKIYNNGAGSKGAGVYLFQGTSALSDNTIYLNNVTGDGGGLYINSGTNTVRNNVFYWNGADYGGAVYSMYAMNNIFTNNTFNKNSASAQGGALRMYDDAAITLRNNIFWANTQGGNAAVAGADIHNQYSAVAPTVSNCLTQQNSSFQGTNGVNNQDPLFVDAADVDGADNVLGTADDGLRLQAASPARNTGLNSAVATLPRDMVGNTRTFGGTVDMGAYEQFDLATFAAVTGTSQAVAADGQYTDATGWTHYVNDATDKYILSIKKNGNDIGNVGEGAFTITANTTAAWGPTAAATISAPYATNTGWKVMNRWWKVTPTTQPATNVQVRTYYAQADLDGLKAVTGDNALTHTQLKFYKINGAGTNPDPALGHSSIAVAANYSANGYWEYNNGPAASTNTWAAGTAGSDFYAEYTVASFSGGGGGGSQGGGNSNPLFPVEWLSFSATPAGDAVVLDWATASEQNNASFTAERSLNGVDFEAIGTIAAIGNSSSPTPYTYPDSDLPAGATTLHYRIRQTDVDGKTSHSEIRTVALDRASGLSVWPNPATNRLSVRVPEGIYAIVLTDAAGHIVRNAATDGQTTVLPLDLSDLATGVYTLRAGTATLRVVKE